MRYGRLAARRPVGLADLINYTGGLLAPPDEYQPPQVADWGMLGNDQYGDCTLAAVVHQRMANQAEDHDPAEVWPTADQVVTTYLTLTHGKDTGLVEADVLHTWHTVGLWGDRNLGYAPVDHRDLEELQAVCASFGAVYTGIVVPQPAEQQFGAGEAWDLTGTAADRQMLGGHAVPLVGYDTDHAWFVTWGRLQPATWRWVGAYLEEAWAVISEEDARVDLARLQADLAALEAA